MKGALLLGLGVLILLIGVLYFWKGWVLESTKAEEGFQVAADSAFDTASSYTLINVEPFYRQDSFANEIPANPKANYGGWRGFLPTTREARRGTLISYQIQRRAYERNKYYDNCSPFYCPAFDTGWWDRKEAQERDLYDKIRNEEAALYFANPFVYALLHRDFFNFSLASTTYQRVGFNPMSFSWGGAGIFREAPENLYRSIPVTGRVESSAIQDCKLSALYASFLYIGDTNFLDKFIRVSYSASGPYKVYYFNPLAPTAFPPGTTTMGIKNELRKTQPFIPVEDFYDNATTISMCKPEFKTDTSNPSSLTIVPVQDNITWNNTNCNSEITSDMLALLPQPLRRFIIEFAYSRMKRFAEFNKQDVNTVLRLAPTNYGIDPREMVLDTRKLFLNMIAQRYYQFETGNKSISYIYDCFTIGSLVLDVRCDIEEHVTSTTIRDKINALKTEYYTARSQPFMSLDDLDALKQKFSEDLDALNHLHAKNINRKPLATGQTGENTNPTESGALLRIYLKKDANAYLVTGYSKGVDAALTYNTRYNGNNLIYDASSNDAPGFINYAPMTDYTLNELPSLDVTQDLTLRRVVADYLDNIQVGISGEMIRTGYDFVNTPQVIVTQVLGAAQINPTQCALQWKEQLYDAVTNAPIGGETIRTARFSYVKNTVDWKASDLIFDASGFTFAEPGNGPAYTFTGRYQDPFDTGSFVQGAGAEIYWRPRGGSTKHLVSSGSMCSAIASDITKYANLSSRVEQLTTAEFNALTTGANFTCGMMRGDVTATIVTRSTPLNILRPLPAETELGNANGLCPTTNCRDPNVLYTLVDTFNNDHTKPGTIVRVLKAVTPSENQCDLQVEIDYSGVKTAPRGERLAPTPAGLSGIRVETRQFDVDINPVSCEQEYQDASGVNSGFFIQPNTPALPIPFVYVKKATEEYTKNFQVISNLTSSIASATSKIQAMLTNFRAETAASVGNIMGLKDCPDFKISSPLLLNEVCKKFDSDQWPSNRIGKIIRVGAYDSLTLDCTIEKQTLTLNQTTNRPDVTATTTVGIRCALIKNPAGCFFTVGTITEVPPSPPWDVIKDLNTKQFTAYNLPSDFIPNYETYQSGVVNYTNTNPLTIFDCRSKQVLKMIADFNAAPGVRVKTIKNVLQTDLQSCEVEGVDETTQVFQTLSTGRINIISGTTTYNKPFLRYYKFRRDGTGFNFMRTSAAYLGTYLLKENFSEPRWFDVWDNRESSQQYWHQIREGTTGAYTNEQSQMYFRYGFKDLNPATKALNINSTSLATLTMDSTCPTLNCASSAVQTESKFPTIYESKTLDANRCEFRVLNDPTLPYSELYKVVTYFSEFDCTTKLLSITGSSEATSQLVYIPTPANQDLMNLFRNTWNTQNATATTKSYAKKIGTILQAGIDTDKTVYYQVTMMSVDINGDTAEFFGAPGGPPIYFSVKFRQRFDTAKTVFILSMTQLGTTAPAGITMSAVASDTGKILFPDPFTSITNFKMIKFTPLKTRDGGDGTNGFLTRIQLFKGDQYIPIFNLDVGSESPAQAISSVTPAMLTSDPTYNRQLGIYRDANNLNPWGARGIPYRCNPGSTLARGASFTPPLPKYDNNGDSRYVSSATIYDIYCVFCPPGFSVNGAQCMPNPLTPFYDDPMLITNLNQVANRGIPFNQIKSLIIVSNGARLNPDGISFMTGSATERDITQWKVEGSVNGVFWKPLLTMTNPVSYFSDGYTRTPIFPFDSTKPTIFLPQAPAKLKTLNQMGYVGSDFPVVREVCRALKRDIPLPNAANVAYSIYVYYITEYMYVENTNTLYVTYITVVKDSNDRVDDASKYIDKTSLLYAKLTLTKTADSSIQVAGGAVWNTAGFPEYGPTVGTKTPFTGITNVPTGAVMPPGWGGFPSFVLPLKKISGNYTISYIGDTTSTPLDLNTMQPRSLLSSSSFADSLEIAAGFLFKTNTDQTTYTTILESPTSRIQLLPYTPVTPVSSLTLYLKRDYEIFRYIRFTPLKIRGGDTTKAYALGKLRFYDGDTVIPISGANGTLTGYTIPFKKVIRNIPGPGKLRKAGAVSSLDPSQYFNTNAAYTMDVNGRRPDGIDFNYCDTEHADLQSNPTKVDTALQDVSNLINTTVSTQLGHANEYLISSAYNNFLFRCAGLVAQDLPNLSDFPANDGTTISLGYDDSKCGTTDAITVRKIVARGPSTTLRTNSVYFIGNDGKVLKSFRGKNMTSPYYLCNQSVNSTERVYNINNIVNTSAVSNDLTDISSNSFTLTYDLGRQIIANGYSFITSPVTDSSQDPIQWKLEISNDNTNWFTMHTATSDLAVPTERGKEFKQMFKSLQKGFNECSGLCGTDALMNSFVDIYNFYNNIIFFPKSAPFAITHTGYDTQTNSCVVKTDLGYTYFSNTKDVNCQTVLTTFTLGNTVSSIPSTITMNPVSGLTTFMYIRFRPKKLGTSTPGGTKLGRIAFYAGGTMIPAVSATSQTGTDNGTASNLVNYTSLGSGWTDQTLGSIIIQLTTNLAGVSVDTFSFLTAADSDTNFPVQWTIEGSLNGKYWQMIQNQATDASFTMARSTQVNFSLTGAPVSTTLPPIVPTLSTCNKSPLDAWFLDAVSELLAIKKIVFNPSSYKYSIIDNKCQYLQKNGSYILVSLSGNTCNTIAPSSFVVTATDSYPLITSTVIPAGTLKGIANCAPTTCLTEPPAETINTTFKANNANATLSAYNYGVYADNNECLFKLDDTYALPLQNKTIGFAFKQKTTCETSPTLLYYDLSYNGATTLAPKQNQYKFIRFRVLKTRDPVATFVHLSKLKLYTTGDIEIDLCGASISNLNGVPNTVGRDTVNNLKIGNLLRVWSDKNKSPINITLSVPTVVTGFSFITAPDFLPGTSPASSTYDPIQWKIEGSSNGYIWDLLHSQTTDYATSLLRVNQSPLFYFNGTAPKTLTQPNTTATGTRLKTLSEAGISCDSANIETAILNWARLNNGTGVLVQFGGPYGKYTPNTAANQCTLSVYIRNGQIPYVLTFSGVTGATDVPLVTSSSTTSWSTALTTTFTRALINTKT